MNGLSNFYDGLATQIWQMMRQKYPELADGEELLKEIKRIENTEPFDQDELIGAQMRHARWLVARDQFEEAIEVLLERCYLRKDAIDYLN